MSEFDVLTFGLGLARGLFAGLIPVPLPGGITLRLDLAGGPLVLGVRERTGPLVRTLPYGANLTLRQVGLLLFLAGAAITLSTTLATPWVGHRLRAIPLGLLIGMLAGVETQSAVLAFALEQTGDDLPNVGYAAGFPIAMIAKILLAQLLLSLWL